MATLRDIRRRIRSVQSTQKITRAMKLVAAAKLRRAQERILAARPYANKMSELLANLVSGADTGHPLLEQREGPRRQIVIITADRGLAGAFNSNILRRAVEFIRESNTAEVTLVVVGRKARDFFRRRPYTIKRDMIGFWDRLAYSHATELADAFMQQYLDGEVDEVHLLYNEFRSVALQRPVRQQLLPIPKTAESACVRLASTVSTSPCFTSMSCRLVASAAIPRAAVRNARYDDVPGRNTNFWASSGASRAAAFPTSARCGRWACCIARRSSIFRWVEARTCNRPSRCCAASCRLRVRRSSSRVTAAA